MVLDPVALPLMLRTDRKLRRPVPRTVLLEREKQCLERTRAATATHQLLDSEIETTNLIHESLQQVVDAAASLQV